MSEIERDSMEFDVVIVGAGPAGLSAAIRLKQINPELSVVVLEKGGEVGAHILSGAVVDPIGMDRLLPEWRKEEVTLSRRRLPTIISSCSRSRAPSGCRI